MKFERMRRMAKRDIFGGDRTKVKEVSFGSNKSSNNLNFFEVLHQLSNNYVDENNKN